MVRRRGGGGGAADPEKEGFAALHFAAGSLSVALVRIFLEHGASPLAPASAAGPALTPLIGVLQASAPPPLVSPTPLRFPGNVSVSVRPQSGCLLRGGPKYDVTDRPTYGAQVTYPVAPAFSQAVPRMM